MNILTYEQINHMLSVQKSRIIYLKYKFRSMEGKYGEGTEGKVNS